MGAPDYSRPEFAWARRSQAYWEAAAYDARHGLSRDTQPIPHAEHNPFRNALGGVDQRRRRTAKDQAFERDDDLGVSPSDLDPSEDEMSAENLYNFFVIARAKLSAPELARFDEMIRLGHDADYKDIDRIAGRTAQDRRLAQDRASRNAVRELNTESFLRRYPGANVSFAGNGRR